MHHCYPSYSFLHNMRLGMSHDAEEKAAKAVSELPAPQISTEEDVKSIVQMCLVKMGDLAR